MRVQCGVRLTRSALFPVEALVPIEHRVALKQIRDGPGQLMRQARQRLPLAGLVLSAGQRLVARRRVAQAQERRVGAGPLQRRLPDRRARGALALPRRFLGACDQAAVGHNILDAREAGEVMDRVEQHPTHNLADAGDGWEPVQGAGIVLLGRPHDGQCDIVA